MRARYVERRVWTRVMRSDTRDKRNKEGRHLAISRRIARDIIARSVRRDLPDHVSCTDIEIIDSLARDSLSPNDSRLLNESRIGVNSREIADYVH